MDVKVLDGGCSTELELEEQITVNGLWSSNILVTNPEAIKRVHRRFLDHGADIIETFSYQASVPLFMKHHGATAEEGRAFMQKSVHLAREVVDEYCKDNGINCNDKHRPLVCGSLSPYGSVVIGGMVEYTGDYIDTIDEKTIEECQRARIQVLAEADIDTLALETIPSKKEAVLLVKIMREFPNTKAWIAMSVKDGQHTCYGDAFSEAAEAITQTGTIKQIGINCSKPGHVAPNLRSVQHLRKDGVEFVAYPNSGEMYNGEVKDWTGKLESEGIPKLVPEWMHLGTTVVGGCCRTTPKDISTIVDVVDRLGKS